MIYRYYYMIIIARCTDIIGWGSCACSSRPYALRIPWSNVFFRFFYEKKFLLYFFLDFLKFFQLFIWNSIVYIIFMLFLSFFGGFCRFFVITSADFKYFRLFYWKIFIFYIFLCFCKIFADF